MKALTWLRKAVSWLAPVFRIIKEQLSAQLTLKRWQWILIMGIYMGVQLMFRAPVLKPMPNTSKNQSTGDGRGGNEADSFEVIVDDYYHDIDSAEVARKAALDKIEAVRADSLQHLLDSLFANPSPRQHPAPKTRGAVQQESRGPDRSPG